MAQDFNIFTAVIVVAIIFAIVLLILIARSLYGFYYKYSSDKAYLKITPPAFTDKPLGATEALFTAIYSLGMHKNLRDRLLNRKAVFSAEITSTKKHGIRFYLCITDGLSETIEKLVASYLPDALVVRDKDPITWDKTRILEFKQAEHFAYPLKNYEELEDNDPIGYITSAMTKLEANEQISLQICFQPKHLKEADGLRKKILRNEDFMPESKVSSGWVSTALKLTNGLLFGIADAFSSTYHQQPSNPGVSSAQKDLEYKKQLARADRPVRTLSYFEHEVIESVNQKLKRPLFQADIRVILCGSTKSQMSRHRKAINAALGLYDVPKYQSLKLKRRKFILGKQLLRQLTEKRLISGYISPNYFAASELAGLYHFPNSVSARTENVVKSLSKTLPAPVSLKSNKKLDVLIGRNKHHNQTTEIGLTEAERERHMYVIGGTGNGKTTLLKYQIVQDIKNGKGLAVVDPHGDLAEELLEFVPKNRRKDLIHLDPDDLDNPIGVNLLEMPEGLIGNDLLREKDRVTESVVSVMRKIFSEDDSGGHRVEYVLRNAVQTALTTKSPTLFTIFRLLNDGKYAKGVIKKLEDKDLKAFWKNELGKAGSMQKVKMAAGITSKIGRFLFSASARAMLEQEKSDIDFGEVLDGKILICNFSKGRLGEDTSMLFGTTILAKLQLAALKRSEQKQADRKSFYLYVDEFQNFATVSFTQMLSEARKYKVFLTMAEQSTQQQDDQKMVEIILANVGTVVVFRTGSPRDEELLLPLFTPYVEQGEISNLPAYNFYCRISGVETSEPMSGETIVLDK